MLQSRAALQEEDVLPDAVSFAATVQAPDLSPGRPQSDEGGFAGSQQPIGAKEC